MFWHIPQPILSRMQALEAANARDRQDGTPRLRRLRQVTPETGKFLALLAANAPEGQFLEIGASGGYSALLLSLALRGRGAKLTTFEVLEEKARIAEETFRLTGTETMIQLVRGDARDFLADYKNVAFCFQDAEKDVYADCYELVVPSLVPGGLFVADNAISHQDKLQTFLNRALNDKRVDALIVPIGKGVLICRKL